MRLKELVEEWRTLGGATFGARHRFPALLGVGIAGALVDRRRGRKSGTIGTAAPELGALLTSAALANRFWWIRPAEARPTGPVRAGRGSDNDIVIPEYSISEQHCEFRTSGANITVVDVGSHNGTFVNERMLACRAAVALQDDDRLVLGRYQFRFLSADGVADLVSGADPGAGGPVVR